MKIEETLEQARENRTTDQFDAYLQNYNVLYEHMGNEEVCIEILLGDIYMEATGRKDKTMRYRHPAGHPDTVLAEFVDLVFGTYDKEFDIAFPKWIDKTGKAAALMACVRFLKGGKKDLSLLEFDLKTVRMLAYFDAEPAYHALDLIMRVNDKKIHGRGARSLTLMNAAIKALEKMGTPRALQSLLRFSQFAQYGRPNKSINILKSNLKLSEAEIEDLKISTSNFDEEFTRIEMFGDLTVTMKLLPDYKMEWKIVDAEGAEPRDFSKGELNEYKDEINELKWLENLVAQDLRRHRDQIEGTYWWLDRSFKYTDWLRLYMNSPLMAYSARRLIWEFTHEAGQRYTGLWFANQHNDPDTTPNVVLHDATGTPLLAMDEKWTVKLWHPVEASAEEQSAWKDRVMSLKVVQPFKQAFRETYTITPPELLTRTYTNRFAAHILYKNQFTVLARSRGWEVSYNYHGSEDPYKYIHGNRITFCMDNKGFFQTVTGRLSFGEIEMASLPPILFSEALLEVDLFVSVCSIGVDPTWTPDRAEYTYWSHYTTGQLSDSAVIRKEVLQRILPGLSIASQCRIEDRWLIVEGKFCTYKIHIGSSSVHMEPNNQHLCIVPQPSNKSESSSVYLPFESDMMLSLILSKAFLLANDKKIKDQTILSQIKSRG